MNGYYQQAYYNSHDSRKSQRSHHQYFQHPAFGGTLSPMIRRQRAFHDAIYEEEYGSDQEDECCQSRGMSAVFCWFLSVIILIGLAASVVLTVFFILKSKSHMSKNGELDLFLDGDHGISYHMPDTTTELNSNVDFSSSAASSKEASIPSSISIEDDDNNDETENNIQFGTLNKSKSPVTSTTTRFPPSRKGPSEISDEKVLRSDISKSSEKAKPSSERPRTSPDYRESTTERPKSDESRSQESSSNTVHSGKSNEDHQATMYTTTTTEAPVQQILFTASPDIVVSPTGHRRNLQTTRFPTGRTSFSTSTPAFDGTDKADSKNDNDSSNKDEDENNASHHSVTQSHNHETDDEEEEDDDEDTEEDETHQEPQLTLTTRHEEPVTTPTTAAESKEFTTEADTYKSEESQLNKMLLDEIPPHDHSQTKEEVDEDSPEEKDSSEEETSQSPFFSSEFDLPPTTLASRPSSTSSSSTSTTTSSVIPPVKEIVRIDPLARLIKNLAPKWGRNRTVESTTLSSGSHKYDFTISSKEKDSQKSSKESTTPEYIRTKSKYKTKQETSTRTTTVVTPEGTTRTRFQSSRPNSPAVETVSILNTIKSPDLSRRHDQDQVTDNSEGVGQFLDILVGSEDHKTLITKQTEDGIVTSAILPPWFNNAKDKNSTSSSSSPTTSTTPTTLTPPTSGSNSPRETSSEEETSNSGSGSDENGSGDAASVFGGLFDLFKKEVAASITPTTTNIPTSVPQDGSMNTPDYSDPKRIILKRPGGELLAQGSSNFAQNSVGSTNGITSTDKAQRKPAISFRDMIKTAAPALLSSSTTIATVDPAVVTDDITPANNGFHYNSPDGGTNIYGYYPDDDDKENDKTVEHMGIQSESMSDEIINKVNPSHSIEVQVPDESAEIVIEHDTGSSSADPKFGEVQAESTNQGKYVEPPIFHGGGIRKPLEEDEDLLLEPDLDTRSSETHAVFAIPLNASSTSPSKTTPKTNSSRSILEKITQRISYVTPPPSKVSQEVIDNSAEKDPLPNNSGGLTGSMEYEEDISVINQQGPHGSSVEKAQSPTGPEGSYEEDLNGSVGDNNKKVPKWSAQDNYGSTEAESSPKDSLIESHPNLKSEAVDTNDVLDRKPVVNLDEKLYPDSAGETSGGTSLIEDSEETKVHQVFPENQGNSISSSSTTTERPAGESSISQPESSADSQSSENKGFNPPTPVSFHDNKYTFSPPPPESIYQSKDGWRPIMKADGEETSRPVSTAPPFWRRQQPILIPTRLPTTSLSTSLGTSNPVKLTDSPSPPSSKPPLQVDSTSQQQQQHLEEDEEYEEEEEIYENVSQTAPQSPNTGDSNNENYSWGNRERLMEQSPAQSPQHPSKVKFPEQTHEASDFDQDVEPQPQLLQVQPHPQQQQPHPIQMMNQQHPHQMQLMQQRPHPLNHQQQQHRPIPKQLQHLPAPPPPHHQQRQQFLFQQNPHNNHQHQQQQIHQNNIDRSKYLMRPAPPPIVMRRAPIQNMPYLPSRDGPVRRQGLVAQVAPQNSNSNNKQVGDQPSPSEFHPQYNNNLRRRFKTLGAQPRSNNNLNWVQEQQEPSNNSDSNNNVESSASQTSQTILRDAVAKPAG